MLYAQLRFVGRRYRIIFFCARELQLVLRNGLFTQASSISLHVLHIDAARLRANIMGEKVGLKRLKRPSVRRCVDHIFACISENPAFSYELISPFIADMAEEGS